MSRERANRWWALSLVLGAQALGGCLEPREREAPRHRSSCTTCHGSPTRPGSELAQSAPPFDVSGSTDARSPGIGAHAVHLTANELHDGVACAECHVVPDRTDSPGHADSALPAEVTFGARARANGRAPSYDGERCANTYCHLSASPSWIPDTEPRDRCASCHAAPPPPPHPASEACHLCHGDVVDETGTIIATLRHIDGVVDVDERCDTCHGSGDRGAPPPDLSGDPTSPGVGAHAVHLEGGLFSAPVACEACHVVPATAGDTGHLGADGIAEVLFGGVAVTGESAPLYDRDTRSCTDSWCHGAAPSPRWTETEPLHCESCHGYPPAAPHPQMLACERCHAPIIDAAGTIVTPSRHVDGVVDVDLPVACGACHGDATSPAPPVDLAGNVATSFRGVGAHRVHVEGTSTSRAVPCDECHRVPEQVIETGHVDTFGTAELRFRGVARAFGASPSFDGATCADTYCHGDRFVLGHDSGGLATQPIWTLTDGSQSLCTSCHGLPPPPPHPPGPSFCSDCHPTIGFPLEILDPSRHVDGVVDLDPF